MNGGSIMNPWQGGAVVPIGSGRRSQQEWAKGCLRLPGREYLPRQLLLPDYVLVATSFDLCL